MPERYVDLHLECACPDWLKPCKHLVAVWLKFARDFDHDRPTPTQLRRLGALVNALQARFHIAAEDVSVVTQPNNGAGIGRYFPAAAFREQLLP